MGRLRRALFGVMLLVFVTALVLRPLLLNPALAGMFEGGILDSRNLLYVPLVLLTVVIAVFRLRGLFQNRADSRSSAQRESQTAYPEWSEREDSTRFESGDRPVREEPGPRNDRRDILSGQGGARDKDFEIEDEPPEVELSAHLEHLQAEFEGDRDAEHDLKTLEEVVTEHEGESKIPPRCPQEHCEARWSERSVLGFGSGRYELLDEGRKARCLECEQVAILE